LQIQKIKILVKIKLCSCESFYNIPGIEKNDSRKAGIGYGKKTDLDYGKHPHNEAPSPDKYNISSFV
jgi:hypothetical protein